LEDSNGCVPYYSSTFMIPPGCSMMAPLTPDAEHQEERTLVDALLVIDQIQ